MAQRTSLNVAGGVSGLAPVGDGRLAVGAHSGEVAVWDVRRGTLRRWRNVCGGRVDGLAGADGLMVAWDRDSVRALSPGGVWSQLAMDEPMRVTVLGHRLLVETAAGGLTEWGPTDAVVRHWRQGGYKTYLVADGDGVTVHTTREGVERCARLDADLLAVLRAGSHNDGALVGAAQLDGPMLLCWGSDGTSRRCGTDERGPLSNLAELTAAGLCSTYRRPAPPGDAVRHERLSIIGDDGTGATLGRLRGSRAWSSGVCAIGDATAVVRWSAWLQLPQVTPGIAVAETRSHWATGFAEVGSFTAAFCLDAGGVAVVDARSLRQWVIGAEDIRATGLVPLSKGRVLVSGEDGCVRILDAATGHLLALRHLEGAWLWGAVEMADNFLVLWTDAERLRTWELDGDGLCS